MRRGVPLIVALVMFVAAQPASGAYDVIGSFGGTGTGDGQFNSPRGVAVGANGNVYVVDGNNNRVQVFGATTQFFIKWGASGGGNGQFNSPGGIAIDGAGNVFVVDVGNYRVQQFDANGGFIRAIGRLGTGPTDFRSNPADVALDGAGNVYVTERGDRVVKFAPDGAFLTAWGSSGSGDGQFNDPEGIDIAADGTVWVADQSNARVQHFDSNGAFLGSFANPGSDTGQFRTPGPVLVLSNGNLLVGDDILRKLIEFRPDGTFVQELLGSAAPGGSFRPAGLAQAPNGEIFLTDVEVNIGNRVLRITRTPDAPPEPELAENVTAEVVRGEVTFRPPGAASFQRLDVAQLIPVGSAIDVSRGTMRMTAAANRRGATQKGNFSGGRFRLGQKRSGLTTLRLQGGSFANCPRNIGRRSSQAAQRRSRRIRRLRGNARGRFRTRGRYGAATVRGTRWVMEDRCNGTLTRVRSGVVVVRDFAKRRRVRLRRGERYLARPRRG